MSALLVSCSENLFLCNEFKAVPLFLFYQMEGICSLIHLDLTFEQDNTFGSIVILLHAAVQCDQHHLMKMLSFIKCNFLDSLFLKKSGFHRGVNFCPDFQFNSIDHGVCFYVSPLLFLLL